MRKRGAQGNVTCRRVPRVARHNGLIMGDAVSLEAASTAHAIPLLTTSLRAPDSAHYVPLSYYELLLATR